IIRHKGLLNTWKQQHFGSENPLSTAATQAAYEQGEDWLQAMNTYLDGNFEWLKQFLQQELPNAKFKIP
ncbi:aminotransferase, partial [Staphylococcus aureus]|nr:aminotransferase [Staphylococcus aureus]